MSFIAVMLLEKSEHAFNDSEYIFEPKLDGIRMIASKINGKTTLWTRHKNQITTWFPELSDVPVPDDVILEGELVYGDFKTDI
ncbi:ATP-dependent DNA ligase [Neobacillus drentensis]|uniref:ATP-dependent DNA ligase n=1 Tax=Neobacillus drentensis TaxID=220684 RepID=UPI003001C5BF